MSYDLYFKKKDDQEFQLNEFKEYFECRPHYHVENSLAVYENDDTDVYFSFDFNETTKNDLPTETSNKELPVSFNLNYLRPHIFSLEAEPEIAAFIEHFGLVIEDPQVDGHTSNIYNAEDFIRGWNKGNEFSYKSIVASNPDIKNSVLPAMDLERYWRWNYTKTHLQHTLGEDIYVPKVSFQVLNGEIKSFILWSDAIPTVFPKVDTVILYRRSLTPSSFFSKAEQDFVIVEYNEILPLLVEEHVSNGASSYRNLLSEKSAREFVSAFPASKVQPTPISIGLVLDKELMT